MRRKRILKKMLSVILTISLLSSVWMQQSSVLAEDYASEQSLEWFAETQEETEEIENVSVEVAEEETEEETEVATVEVTEETEGTQEDEKEVVDTTNLYEEGCIKIYTLKQLEAIGTGKVLSVGDAREDSFGTGEVITDKDGNVVTYALDGVYQLMNDIQLNPQKIWTLPAGFTGNFVGNDEVTEEDPLYDGETDTIHVYHNYQLAVISSENAQEEPVMSRDMIAQEFGIGQLVYKDGAGKDETNAQEYLTYSDAHNYVLDIKFTEKMPEIIASAMAQGTISNEQLAGRKHVGQVYTEINGEKYILIGNEQQLRAIGTGNQVTPMLFVRTEVHGLFGVPLGVKIIPYYPGDADLNVTDIDATGIEYQDIADEAKDFQYLEKEDYDNNLLNPDFDDPNLLQGIVDIITGTLEGILSILGSSESELVGLKDENTDYPSIGQDKNNGWFEEDGPEYASLDEIVKKYQDLKYTADANYIIFRDIDLSAQGTYSNKLDDKWTPLAFSGTMIGAKNMAGVTENGVAAADDQVVTLSGIKVIQERETINPEDLSQRGTGFFSSVGAEMELNSGHIKSKGKTELSNLCLADISVTNSATNIENPDQGILGNLVSGLDQVILKPLLTLLGLESVSDLVERLANGESDPTMLATGAFAGRVYGDVEIVNCCVSDASVSSQSSMTGGFVGSVDGIGEYEIIGEATSAITALLTEILDLIPYLGAGDLVNNLLGSGVLNLNFLLPTGYLAPTIRNCSVSGITGSGSYFGVLGKDFQGLFAGKIEGSVVEGCNVTVNSDITVLGRNYIGGFAGAIANKQINGLLSSLDLDVLNSFFTQSVVDECHVWTSENHMVSVTGQKDPADTSKSVNGGYVGGFAGAIANSYVTGCTASNINKVTAADAYAGGFAGTATLGSAVALGDSYNSQASANLFKDLLEIVKNVLGPDKESQILSLVGVSASYVYGCQVTGNALEVTGTDYVGGFLGEAEGTQILPYNLSTISSLKPFEKNKVSVGSEVTNALTSLTKVSGTNFVGGYIGKMSTANAGGIVGETVGLAQFLPVKIEDVTITGVESGYTVNAGGSYAGGFSGQGLGSSISNVTINKVGNIQAENYAAGFLGSAGVGSLAEAGGLDLLGLGLVKAKNLLSVAEGIGVNITNATVSGAEGFTVLAKGTVSGTNYFAGGFVGENHSGDIEKSSVTGLSSVETTALADSYAGGFVAVSDVGGLAEVSDQDSIKGFIGENNILSVESLVQAVGYLIPTYTDCYVAFESASQTKVQVKSACAGGFIGEIQGGTIDNSDLDSAYAVRGLNSVEGVTYAGGFAGNMISGGLAQSDGLSILGTDLGIDLDGLLSILEVYIPSVKRAGVLSALDESGLSEAQPLRVVATDPEESYAGGFVGLAQGAKITLCDVKNLATRSDISEAATDSGQLEEMDYAVVANNYAGGFAGKIAIGSAAAVGGGLNVLNLVNLSHLLGALNVVASRVEQCDTYGTAGGFNVLSKQGSAGGYAGLISGAVLNDSDSNHFEYIDGVISAGGYAGTIEPGSIASLGEKATLLEQIVEVNDLLTLVKAFIPKVYNSETNAVPCGGYVKATGTSENGVLKGLAGGYVGYNLGGRIEGNISDDEIYGTLANPKTAGALRIRSVLGQEFAGGFTGLMKAANIADTGNISILESIKIANPVNALQAVYATEKNTQVTGPLRGISIDIWNAWVEAVGSKGVYGEQFVNKTFPDQTALDDFLKDYIYGYTVEANAKDNGTGIDDGGSAGGYVGRMEAGIIENAHAQDVKSVIAYRSAGGFAGEAETGTVVNAGNIELGDLTVLDGLGLVKTFVPVIKASKVTGYHSGATIEASAESNTDAIGNAGGFVGLASGLQVLDSESHTTTHSAIVENLKSVKGHQYVGGFAGNMHAGISAGVDGTTKSGLLNQILGVLISQDTLTDLIDVLQASRTVVESAKITGYGTEPVFAIIGNQGQKAVAAGGFAGKLTGALVGSKDSTTAAVEMIGLKSVYGGKYSGGFFGIADVDGLAEVSDENNTNILELLGLNSIDVLNIFKTYIYSANVVGNREEGLSVYAQEETTSVVQTAGTLFRNVVDFFSGESSSNTVYKDGNAGGFGGSLMSSYVENCRVENLNWVSAPNYAGGFIGLTGKSGLLDADKVTVLEQLLGASAGVLDIFGSHIDNSKVNGVSSLGYIVRSENGSEEISAGFVGYGDLARIDNCHVTDIKQVYSDEIAGGFIGKASYEYLVQTDISSPILLNPVLAVVNQLLDILYVDELEQANVIEIKLPTELGSKVLSLTVLADGNTASVTLLGLKISVALIKANGDQSTDVAQIHIGDSYIEVPCYDTEGDSNHIKEEEQTNIQIGLIKANRTKVENSTITGITDGYDVYGGGASNEQDGTSENGCAGGFVGYNNEGLFEKNQMIYADTIRGTSGLVGEFSGKTRLETNYETINNLNTIEGNGNTYKVYRISDSDQLLQINTAAGEMISRISDSGTEKSYYIYPVVHRALQDIKETEKVSLHKALWEGAYQTTSDNSNVQFPVKVYVSDAQADLMLGTSTDVEPSEPDKDEGMTQDPCAEEITLQIQKLWFDKNDQNNTRPESITIQITQNGKEYQTITMNAKEHADIDPDSWLYSLTVPARDDLGNLFEYDVVEITVDGTMDSYVTIYDQSQDGYTFYISNYLTGELLQDDTIVIDYGLPVDVDVLTNDKFVKDDIKATLSAVGTYSEDRRKTATAALPEGFVSVTNQDDCYTAAYGTAKVGTAMDLSQFEPDTPVIHYIPNTMEMDSFDRMLYAVELDPAQVKNGQNYVYGSLTVIPATEIFYEDNFETISYIDGSVKSGDNPAIWTEVSANNGSTDAVQDTDRPGMDEVKKLCDNLYGNDSHYTDDATYSNGTSKKVAVNINNTPFYGGSFPTATFTFKGTGFDVISVTSGDTGLVKMTVFEKDENGGWKQRDKQQLIDTYYGYQYVDGEWIVDETANETNALYQVPVIKVEDLPYGEYKVELTPSYLPGINANDEKEQYEFYLDAIRIYDPADPSDGDYKEIEDVYKKDGENNPRFTEIRDILLNANNISEINQNGTVFVDGNGQLSDMKDYESYGSKNEVYLSSGQAISFYLWTDHIPDQVQLSAKLAMGSQANLYIATAVKTSVENEWAAYKTESHEIKTAYDLYYDFSEQCIWELAEPKPGEEKTFRTYRTKYPIVIGYKGTGVNGTAPETSVLSLTNLQWTGEDSIDTEPKVSLFGDSNSYDSYELVATANRDNVLAAYSLLNEKVERTIAVHYLDRQGRELAEPYVTTVKDGSDYDMTAYATKEIEGYQISEVTGGDVIGKATEDVSIQVIYEASMEMTPLEYSVTVRYVNKEGKELAEPYFLSRLKKGETYDVSGEVTRSIEGYQIIDCTGDAINGEIDGNKMISVVYEKKMYQVCVQYLDQNGSKLAEDYETQMEHGSSYDVSDYVHKEIEGYQELRVIGDDPQGMVFGDVVVQVIYTKSDEIIPLEYSVTVRYVDTEGKELAEPYMLSGLEKGESYDVSGEVIRSVEGYEIADCTGDAVSGMIDNNKVIVVVYEKVQENTESTESESDGSDVSESESQPEPESEPESAPIDTGDHTNLMIPVAVLLLALCVIVGIIIQGRKKK